MEEKIQSCLSFKFLQFRDFVQLSYTADRALVKMHNAQFQIDFFILELRNFPSGKVYFTVLERKCKRLWLVDFVNLAPEKFNTFIQNNEQQILSYNLFKFCKWMNDSDSVVTGKEDKAIQIQICISFYILCTPPPPPDSAAHVVYIPMLPALYHTLQISSIHWWLLFWNTIFWVKCWFSI